MSIEQLKEIVKAFRDARDWEKFHDPKNLAEAIAIEAGELQETFLWKTKEEIAEKLASSPAYKQAVVEELADIICFSLNMTTTLGIDLSDAVVAKLEKAAKKFPVGEWNNKAGKYNEM
jgi:dCTP diphosphatase